MWIELDKNYTNMLSQNNNYINFTELSRQMLLTSMFCKRNQEFILAMREVEKINEILPTLVLSSEIERMMLRRIELSDFIGKQTTPPEYFPYSLEEIISYIERIEQQQKMLNIPY
jgi:hypothetical protein